MSEVIAGRLLMLILNVICPASSFETVELVMSGALASSPVESGKLWELTVVRAVLPSAAAGSATSATEKTRSQKRRAFKIPPFSSTVVQPRQSRHEPKYVRERPDS